MKTSQDPRHKRRQRLVQDLFSVDFHKQQISREAQVIQNHQGELDKIIEQVAPEFPITKINKIDMAILRLAIYELSIEKKEPENVIIDEAIELAKEFGNDTSPSFINGVLGNIQLHEKST
jgi:N utilization substance protein B